jgi:hypothetical protein
MNFLEWRYKEYPEDQLSDKGLAYMEAAWNAGYEEQKKKRIAAKLKVKDLGGYTEHFETFWKDYPKRVAKGAAYQAWKKINLDEAFLLLSCRNALEWQIQSKSWKDGYIPNPETYLNQRRWEDEAQTIQRKSLGDLI